jgi:tetratricopeptide (TPR) repeat protein
MASRRVIEFNAAAPPSNARTAHHPKGEDIAMNILQLRKQASGLALAIALATGTAMVAGHIVPDAAHAQRKKKKSKEESSDSKPQYSKEFVAAFSPLNDASNAEGANIASLRPQLDQVMALAQNPDEKFQSGLLAYNMGIKAEDLELRLLGMETMLESGKAPIDAQGQYNYIAYQTASMLKQYEKARGYLKRAMDLGFSGGASQSDLLVAMAQNHFNTKQYAEGLGYLDQAIKAKQAAGEPLDEQLYEIAFSVAYREDLQPQVYDYAIERAARWPTDENWRNAINVVRVLNDYGPQPTLDILRLSRMADVMSDKQDYIIYVETADARRLPQEVKDVIEEGYASGALDRDDPYIAEQLRIATGRISADRADLPSYEKDAMAAGAELRTVLGAGSAFLNYGDYAKAAMFFEKAAAMPGADTEEVLTRLGIAQVGMGDYAAARETFGKITGARAPIGRVWAGYAASQSGDLTGAGSEADDGPSLKELTGA